jgi:ABC-type multidrug transport system ATPase subunit
VKRYGDVTAMAGVDFGVRAGEVFGFLGPNGAGKTTTINMLTGLARPTVGKIGHHGTGLAPKSDVLKARAEKADADLALVQAQNTPHAVKTRLVQVGCPLRAGRGPLFRGGSEQVKP